MRHNSRHSDNNWGIHPSGCQSTLSTQLIILYHLLSCSYFLSRNWLFYLCVTWPKNSREGNHCSKQHWMINASRRSGIVLLQLTLGWNLALFLKWVCEQQIIMISTSIRYFDKGICFISSCNRWCLSTLSSNRYGRPGATWYILTPLRS